MKLNNKGWGLTYLIVAGCIILLVLIISSIRINNLIKESKKSHKEPESVETKDVSYSAFYKTLEEELEKAGDSYSLYHETLIDNATDHVYVTYNTLKEEGYISSLPDPEGSSSCDGFVIIYNDYSIKSYINCQNYKTDGYDNWEN